MKQGKVKTGIKTRRQGAGLSTATPIQKKAAQDLTVIRKTFQQDGRWIERPKKTPIFICECSNRYLKTRPGQRKCLTCIAHRR